MPNVISTRAESSTREIESKGLRTALTRIVQLADYEADWQQSTLPPYGFPMAQMCVGIQEQRQIEQNRQEILRLARAALSKDL